MSEQRPIDRMLSRMFASARRTVEAVWRQSKPIPPDAPRFRVTRTRYGYSIARIGDSTPETRHHPPRGPWDVEIVDARDD
jgi:hypothetical protein